MFTVSCGFGRYSILARLSHKSGWLLGWPWIGGLGNAAPVLCFSFSSLQKRASPGLFLRQWQRLWATKLSCKCLSCLCLCHMSWSHWPKASQMAEHKMGEHYSVADRGYRHREKGKIGSLFSFSSLFCIIFLYQIPTAYVIKENFQTRENWNNWKHRKNCICYILWAILLADICSNLLKLTKIAKLLEYSGYSDPGWVHFALFLFTVTRAVDWLLKFICLVDLNG